MNNYGKENLDYEGELGTETSSGSLKKEIGQVSSMSNKRRQSTCCEDANDKIDMRSIDEDEFRNKYLRWNLLVASLQENKGMY